MREIKFRQPVYTREKFSGWHYWGYTTNELGFFTSPLSSNNGEIKESYQFTGLLDKNGKEIYEGELLSLGGSGEKIEVRWDEESQGWSPKVLKGDTNWEVVENAYENLL